MKRKNRFPGIVKYLFVFVFITFCAFGAIAQSLGDVNSSGTIDIVDALLVAQYYVGLGPASFNPDYADVNCSAAIDIVDALLVAQYYVGLISQFPCASTPGPTAVQTETPTPTAVQSATPTPATTPDVTQAPQASFKLQYRCMESAANATQIRPVINIVSTSSVSVPLSELTARYYYSKEGSSGEDYRVDYAGPAIGTGNIVLTAGTGYLQVGFSAGAGNLNGFVQTGEIQIRANKTDWTAYDQSNDWSFDGTVTAFTDWDRIALFRNGTLVWGNPSDGGTPPPPTADPPTAEPTATPEVTPTPDYTVPTPGATNSLGAAAVRLNQAGYASADNYKTAVVAGISGTFTVYNAKTGASAYSGSLTSLGSDSGTGETLYQADFSSLTAPGVYYVMAGSEPSPKFEIRDDLYNKVLYYTLRVYGANRCGDNNSWIHAACHTLDGSIRGTGKEGTLAGGWHDCGDHVKFGGTLGYAAAMLLYSYIAFPDKFGDVYGSSYDGTYTSPSPDGIPDVINEAKIGTDYLLNLYNASVEDGLIAQNKMYYQVGDGDDDHSWWNKPEYQDSFGQAKGGAPREVYSDIGPDIAGRYSASLAMMYLIYGQWDASYAADCLAAAKAIYDVGKSLYGKTGLDAGGKGYYAQDYRADDDLALAGTMLYKATGTDYYINNTTGAQYWFAVEQKWQFQSYYVLSFPNLFAPALHAYHEYATTVDNAEPVIDTQIVTKAECIEWLKADVLDTLPETEIYGRKWEYGWGTCRYMMGIAATAALALDLDPSDATMMKIAKDQMNWVFGRNQFGMSFVVGNSWDDWLTKYPLHPHHRAANPDGTNVPELQPYAATELTGATIGGPSAHTKFSDAWDDYVSTETGIDYWAGTFFTAAFFAK